MISISRDALFLSVALIVLPRSNLAWAEVPVQAQTKRTVIVHGHRGARGKRPENTLPAFEFALRAGVDFLEMDMAVTQDKQILISHDPFLSKQICLGPKGEAIATEPLIFSLTLSEVKKYDCGSLKNPRFAEQLPVPHTPRPTLDEVFDLVEKSNLARAKTVRFNVETKIFANHPEYTVGPEEFVQLFYKIVKKHRMEKRVVLQSFDFRTLAAMRNIDQNIPISALVEKSEDPSKPTPDLIAVAHETGADILSPESLLVTKDTVDRLHALKVQVVPWTVNKPQEWQKLIDMGVDGLITDVPDDLLQFLNRGR